MIAEPLEKGLAEDIENEVVQIGWNRFLCFAILSNEVLVRCARKKIGNGISFRAGKAQL